MSVPCVVCESNIVKGYVAKIKKDHPDDETRYICAKCVQDVYWSPQEHVDHSTVEIEVKHEIAY